MKILVLFGSKSDSFVSEPLVDELKKSFTVDFEVISAHRNPDRLHERLGQDDFHCIVAGAGLSAHLPGVCASLTKKPVFGLPVTSQLGGMDSLMSIVQMPYGIPVGSLSPGNGLYLRSWLEDFLNTNVDLSAPEINLVIDPKRENHEFYSKELSRLNELMSEMNFKHTTSAKVDETKLNIQMLAGFDTERIINTKFSVNNFILDTSEKATPQASLKYFSEMNKNEGVYCGISNTRNSLLFWNKLIEVRRSL